MRYETGRKERLMVVHSRSAKKWTLKSSVEGMESQL